MARSPWGHPEGCDTLPPPGASSCACCAGLAGRSCHAASRGAALAPAHLLALAHEGFVLPPLPSGPQALAVVWAPVFQACVAVLL